MSAMLSAKKKPKTKPRQKAGKKERSKLESRKAVLSELISVYKEDPYISAEMTYIHSDALTKDDIENILQNVLNELEALDTEGINILKRTGESLERGYIRQLEAV